MKLGVLTNVIGDTPLKEALAYFKGLGIQMVEIGCGGYPGKDHCDPGVLLHDEAKFNEFVKTIEESGLQISALSCHGNPVHPNKEIAKQFDDDMHNAVLMAEKLGIHQINCFSGCPGDCPTSENPNWVVCAWPNEFCEVVEWQWNEILIPYWKDFVAFAKSHGVNKIALEMHQGFCVYNTYTLKKLREAVGPEIGANLDPSPGRRRHLPRPCQGHQDRPRQRPHRRHPGLPSLRQRDRALLDLPLHRLRPRRAVLEGLRLPAAPGGLRLRALHRA